MAKITNKNNNLLLENTIDPSTFFDLGSFSNGRIGNKQIKVTVSEKHMYLSNRLKESGLFRINTVNMNRGLLMLGLLADCLHNHLCQKKATNIIKQSKGLRYVHNIKEINSVVSHLDKGEKTDDLLFDNFIKYGNNIYGASILNFIPMYNLNSPKANAMTRVKIPVEIKNLCKAFSKEPPTDSRFKVSRQAKNDRFLIWVPNHIKIIAFSLMKSSLVNTRLMSDIYRGGYVTGLYILCKWIIKGRLPSEEYCLCSIMHNLYNYLAEHE
jgi:hypothetical protein